MKFKGVNDSMGAFNVDMGWLRDYQKSKRINSNLMNVFENAEEVKKRKL